MIDDNIDLPKVCVIIPVYNVVDLCNFSLQKKNIS